jgi:magnesium chelatase family protein
MLGQVHCSAIQGVEALGVDVEVRVRNGLPRFNIIGLGDSAVRESRDRILSALQQSGFKTPNQILINLAPAELKKEGAAFDLPMAIGILMASGQLSPECARTRAFFGELALDGRIKRMKGCVAVTIQALQQKLHEIIVPCDNLAEARLIEGIKSNAALTLRQLVAYLLGQGLPEELALEEPQADLNTAQRLSEVIGQETAKRALVIAASGGHNVLMIGPPGCGKSMLAERFPSLLPPLNKQEILQTVKIHSIAGQPVASLLQGHRPYRNPHYGTSDAGLVGGGSTPRPGEISLAHHGVLFLDEFPEFRRSALEALRAPLEQGVISVARAKSSLIFPARFQLIAAMNPCPCGRLGLSNKYGHSSCSCTRAAIQAYLKKLSGPILDRIDLHVELEGVPLTKIAARYSETGSNTDPYQDLIAQARLTQLNRQATLNSELQAQQLAKLVKLKPSAWQLLEHAAKRIDLSARAFIRVLRVARSIADLEAETEVRDQHIAEALTFRSLELIHGYAAENGPWEARPSRSG